MSDLTKIQQMEIKSNSKDWQTEKSIYQKRIQDLENEIKLLKTTNSEILRLVQSQQVSQQLSNFNSSYSFKDVKPLFKPNNKTDSSSSGQTNINSHMSHTTKNNTLNPKALKMMENTTSKRSSDESEVTNFKKRLSNSRKTKSYGNINLNELISQNILGATGTGKQHGTQNININLYSNTLTQPPHKIKQDSDPLKHLKSSASINIQGSSSNSGNINHIQMSKLYKNAKGQKHSDSNKKLFLSNIDEAILLQNTCSTEKLNKKIVFNKENFTTIHSKENHSANSNNNSNFNNHNTAATFINIGSTAQLVSSLLSNNFNLHQTNRSPNSGTSNYTNPSHSNPGGKHETSTNNYSLNIDTVETIADSNLTRAKVPGTNSKLHIIEVKSRAGSRNSGEISSEQKNNNNLSQNYQFNKDKLSKSTTPEIENTLGFQNCNLTTINPEMDNNMSLSLSMSSFKNAAKDSSFSNQAQFTKEANDSQKTEVNQKKLSSAQSNKIYILNTNTLNNTINSSNNILENSSNSNKTQDTVINCGGLANDSTNSLKGSVKSHQLNYSMNSNSPKTNPFLVLKYHLDSVRAVALCREGSLLLTTGDDMLINIWSISSKEKELSKECKEPVVSLRGHNNPVYRMESYGNEFFTSGIDGIIRHWHIPESFSASKSSPNCYNYDPDLVEFESVAWQGSSEMIWSLKMSENKLLASASSEGYIKVWKIPSIVPEESQDKKIYKYNSSQGRSVLCQLAVKNQKLNILEIPTSLCWDGTTNLFASYVSPVIKSFDIETKKVVWDLSFQADKTLTFDQQQANCIVYHQDKHIVITCHENKQIKFYDPRITTTQTSSALIKSIVGHTDSISTIELGLNEFELISACHDGTVRCWDMRNFNLLNDISCHRTKYDEGVLSLLVSKKHSALFTSGADGVVKGFKYQ